MQLFNLYHSHTFSRAIHKDFWRFEISVWLHTIARSLVAIFIPILLLELGYDMATVIMYYVAMNIVDVPMNFLAEKFVEKRGAKATIGVATVAALAYFGFLANATSGAGIGLLLGLAVLDGIYDAFYFVPHIYLFLRSSKSGVAREAGMLYGIRTFGSMCGPLVGAALFILGMQNVLLAVSILFFIISFIPLLYLRHAENRPAGARTPALEVLRDPVNRRNFFSIFLNSIHAASEAVVWPLFIYATLTGGGTSVAIVAIIVSLSKVAFSYFTGTIHRSHRLATIATGGLLLSAVWVGRLLVTGAYAESFYYVSVILVGFFSLLIEIPIDSGIFEKGRAGDSLRYSTLRNTISMSGQLFLYVVLASVANVFSGSFTLAASSAFAIALIAAAVSARLKSGR